MINKLAAEIYENAKSKGLYEGNKTMGELLCKIHSEVSEAFEADNDARHCDLTEKEMYYNDTAIFNHYYRVHIKGTVEEEMADIIITALSISAFKGIDIESHIKAKMRYNLTRPYGHIKE